MLALGGALLATLMLGGTALAANTTVVVTPTNPQGWVVLPDNPPVPYDFNGPADSNGGNGSLQFGPVGPIPAAKLELQPPETNFPVTDFGGFDYEFQVLAPAAVGVSAKQFYTNVYVDSAANGIGFFGSAVTSTGFYDCRYSYVPQSSGSGWNLFSVSAGTTPDSLASRHSSCATTLAGFSDASEIQFFRLNGGDTSANDNGLQGAFDLVAVTIDGDTTTYDFEPYDVATAKDDCKDGGWMNVTRANGTSFKNQGDCIQYVNTGK